jgi:hypothetical protein
VKRLLTIDTRWCTAALATSFIWCLNLLSLFQPHKIDGRGDHAPSDNLSGNKTAKLIGIDPATLLDTIHSTMLEAIAIVRMLQQPITQRGFLDL